MTGQTNGQASGAASAPRVRTRNLSGRLCGPARLGVALAAVLTTQLIAAERPRIDPAGVPGEILLSANEVPAAAAERFLKQAAGRVLVLTAGKETASRQLKDQAARSGVKIEVRPLAASDDGSLPDLSNVAGLWLAGSDVGAMRRAVVGTEIEKGCAALLKRGGILAASGPVCSLLARTGADGKPGGCDLLPDAVVEAGEKKAGPGPYLVHYHVGPGAALQVKGRSLAVLGDGKVTARLGGSKTLKPRTVTLSGGRQEDLTALRRAARDRAENFPPAQPGEPVVEKGTLVIIGGGGMPAGMIGKFVELAGGKEAKIVVLPTAIPDPLPKRDGIAEAFRKAGARKVTTLPGRTPDAVESREYLDAMREATGLWFGGGRQWRFIDAYEETKLVPLMFDVLNRGGVIGGSSAGATVQGEYLCRGGVFENFAIRYEGYERGLAFLPGVAIDQHFAQRKRFKDLTELMKVHPQYLGIGIDEATALVVRGSVAEVAGRGRAHFYDAKKPAENGKPDHESLPAGERYDLKARKKLPKGEKRP